MINSLLKTALLSTPNPLQKGNNVKQTWETLNLSLPGTDSEFTSAK